MRSRDNRQHRRHGRDTRPIIDPGAVAKFEQAIAQELLRFAPLPGPDEIDVKDAAAIAPLLKKFDWSNIRRIGAWLFSNDGWPRKLKSNSGIMLKNQGQPSANTLDHIFAQLRNVDVE
jgi:hypothetical protein